LELSQQADFAMKDWIAANPQGKHGVHTYHRDQFGLSDALIEEWFGEYVKRFELAEKPAA
jgi:hypothetical protein